MISKRYKALPQETRMLKHDKIENLLKIIAGSARSMGIEVKE